MSVHEQDQLRPPKVHDHHRWHWIETEHGMMCASWFPLGGKNGSWDISGHVKHADDPQAVSQWRYAGPAIPPIME